MTSVYFGFCIDSDFLVRTKCIVQKCWSMREHLSNFWFLDPFLLPIYLLTGLFRKVIVKGQLYVQSGRLLQHVPRKRCYIRMWFISALVWLMLGWKHFKSGRNNKNIGIWICQEDEASHFLQPYYFWRVFEGNEPLQKSIAALIRNTNA